MAAVETAGACSQHGCRSRTRCIVATGRDPAVWGFSSLLAVYVCGDCRRAGEEEAPPALEGPRAGPWVVLWLRRAGRIPFLPKETPP